MSNSIISIKNLEKTFLGAGQPLTILKDLDMEVEEGSKSIIIGASGSGKSTLLNIIGGLESSTRGDIFVGPYEISKLKEKQLTEYKLVFFTNISHEFRTPLTLIQGALEKIQYGGKVPKEMAYSLKVMEKSTQRLLRLINQLLEFRKMQNNKLALSLEETDVIAFLYEIFLSFNDASRAVA